MPEGPVEDKPAVEAVIAGAAPEAPSVPAPRRKLKLPKHWLTLSISVLALVVSGLSFYFQYFMTIRSQQLLTQNPNVGQNDLVVFDEFITNNGNKPIVISDGEVQFEPSGWGQGAHSAQDDADLLVKTSVRPAGFGGTIEPGNILERKICVIVPYLDFSHPSARSFDISQNLHVFYADGVAAYQNIKIGNLRFIGVDDAKHSSIDFVLSSAAPISIIGGGNIYPQEAVAEFARGSASQGASTDVSRPRECPPSASAGFDETQLG